MAGDALPILWARAHVEDRMTSYMDPGRSSAERDVLREEVTELGLAHRLVTQWTSFVAVAKPVVNAGGHGREVDVAVPQVEGVSDLAYPPSALPAGGLPPAAPAGKGFGAAPQLVMGVGPVPQFHGSSAPEPSTWVALLSMAAVGGVWLRRRHPTD
jgi:hypothetical protein